MRRVALTVSSLSVLALLAFPGAALGHGTVDQEHLGPATTIAHSQHCPAQTFTAGRSGSLVAVSVYIRQDQLDSGDLLVEIRNTDEGVPGGNVLASTVVPRENVPTLSSGWVHVDFPTPAHTVAGTTYALALSDSGGDPFWSSFEWAVSAGDQYAGGGYFQQGGCTGPFTGHSFDALFQTFVIDPQPDGRIRRGWGDWTGGNIYNTTGAGQSRQGDAEPGHWRSFRIEVQNDGDVPDKFTIDADGAAVNGYRVKFMKGTTEITSAVNQGTFQTRWLDPGERSTIEAWVKVQAGASEGSSISRLVTLSSLTDPTEVDAVRFTVSRR